MARKEYEQRERRYVQEYVAEKFPNAITKFFNMAVGPAPEELKQAHPEIPEEHFRRWRFWVDACVVLEHKIVLIEGKLRKPTTGMGQLLHYRSLIPDTRELKPYLLKPVEIRLVTPKPDPRVITAAANMGIIVDVYTKDWVQQYLREIGLA